MRVKPKAGFQNISTAVITGDLSSHHQAQLKSAVDLGERVEVSGALHYVSKSMDGLRPAFTDLWLRAAYQATDNIQIAISGANLLKSKRLEYYQINLPFPPNYVARTGQIEIRTRF